MFLTYRESMALIARGIDLVEALTLLRGDWHWRLRPDPDGCLGAILGVVDAVDEREMP